MKEEFGFIVIRKYCKFFLKFFLEGFVVIYQGLSVGERENLGFIGLLDIDFELILIFEVYGTVLVCWLGDKWCFGLRLFYSVFNKVYRK